MSARISNEKLLTDAYAQTHRAADQVSALYSHAQDGTVLRDEDIAPKLTELRNSLQRASCAVLELELRARKHPLPEIG